MPPKQKKLHVLSKEPQINVFYEMNKFLKRAETELSWVYTVIDQKVCFNCLFKKHQIKDIRYSSLNVALILVGKSVLAW